MALNTGISEYVSEESFRMWHGWGGPLIGGSPLRDGCVELLLRTGIPAHGHGVFINMGCGAFLPALPREVVSCTAVHLHCGDHLAFEYNAAQQFPDAQSYLNWPWETPVDWAGVDFLCLRIFRDSGVTFHLLEHMRPLLAAHCTIWLLGPKREGILTQGKKLHEKGWRLEEWASGASARILRLGLPSHGTAHPVYEGVFGADGVDEGTALLRAHLPPMRNERVLDFGCGTGILARDALEGGAAGVYASDHYVPACRAAALVLKDERAQIGCHFLHLGLVGSFSVILTNPPFHGQGGQDTGMGRYWLRSCRQLLADGGLVRLVANSFLDYGALAAEAGFSGRTVTRTRRFTVWELSTLLL